ncbi:thioredoxin-disulfide reductase [Chloroflexota bacterium]
MDESNQKYDVVIIGGGPAGLSAGLYTSRARLSSLIIERGIIGGQITNTEQVDNYPGFPEGIGGIELTQLMHRQAEKHGMKITIAEVTCIEIKGKQKVVKTTNGDLTAKAVIIANGAKRQKLGVPGEEEFSGKGVSFCATCDAAFFREKTVAVVGGGDAAIAEALLLSRFASKVIVIHRRDQLRATAIEQEKAFAEPTIEFLWDTVVEEIAGEDFVTGLKLRNITTGKKSAMEVDGIFIAVGFKPNTDYLKGLLTLSDSGAIITNDRLETSVPGIFAAGDIRQNSIRQVISAAGDGAVAAISADRFIAEYGSD